MVPHCDNLPPFPTNDINELNLFAGQLYFWSIDAYEETCGMLGLYLKELPEILEQYADVIGAPCFVRRTEATCIGSTGGSIFLLPGRIPQKVHWTATQRPGFPSSARELSEIDFGQSSRLVQSPSAENLA